MFGATTRKLINDQLSPEPLGEITFASRTITAITDVEDIIDSLDEDCITVEDVRLAIESNMASFDLPKGQMFVGMGDIDGAVSRYGIVNMTNAVRQPLTRLVQTCNVITRPPTPEELEAGDWGGEDDEALKIEDNNR